jgi:lipopolysaccharide export system permease protein
MKPTRISGIDRYLFRQLTLALLAVSGGLLALIWLTQSLRFVDVVVNRGLSVGVFFKLTGLLIPNFLAVILPITCFIVALFVYQRLASDRELTVMRAAGLSQFGLARAGLGLAAVATTVGFVLSLWLVPASFNAFRQYQFEIRNQLAAVMLQEGVFNTISDSLTIYVRARDPDGTLHGLLIDDARQPDNHSTTVAEMGKLVGLNGNPQVLLINGSRQEIDRKTGRLDVLSFSQNTIDLSQQTEAGELRYRDVGELSMAELISPDTSSPALIAQVPRIRVELNRRLTAPLTTVSFVIIALYAALSGRFQRHGGLMRPLVAVLVVVGLLALGLAITDLAVRVPVMVPLLWVHALLPGLIAGGLLFGGEVPAVAHRSMPARGAA